MLGDISLFAAGLGDRLGCRTVYGRKTLFELRNAVRAATAASMSAIAALKSDCWRVAQPQQCIRDVPSFLLVGELER